MDNITLLIFTCEGKEHLLPDTFKSFRGSCVYKFDKIILAIDGIISKQVIDIISPDLIVQNYSRKGYIFNIINALKAVETEFLFWLEDDFYFPKRIDLDFIKSNLELNGSWSGIFLNRSTILSEEEKEIHFYDSFYRPKFGYSVSPTLCRTAILKEAFQALIEFPKDSSTKLLGFETFINNYFLNNGFDFAILDPVGNNPSVEHVGKLESTAREYHMINSLEQGISDVGKEYISGFGDDRKITIHNKLSMVLKLIISFAKLIILQLISREIYDYALRIVIASKKGFKN